MEAADREFIDGLKKLRAARVLADTGAIRRDETISRAAAKMRARALEMMTRVQGPAHAADPLPFNRCLGGDAGRG